jgi:glycosyltransferase involved in cell wall biosynthesis
MKVCQLCAIDFTLKNFLTPLIDGMVNEGWDVSSVCSNGDFVPELRKQGYKITNIEISRSVNPFKHLVTVFKLFKFFRKEKFDLVHVHSPVASLVGRLAAWMARIPLVIYTAHGFYFHDEMPIFKKWIYIFLEIIAGKITSFLFTQSLEDCETAIKRGIVKSDKVLAIGNGVNVERFDPLKYQNKLELKSELGFPEDAFIIGMISRLVKEKGVVEFLEAAKTLHLNNPNLYFLLIGDRLVSDHAERVTNILKSTKQELGSNIVLTGMRADIPELLSIMNLYCLPSWREGMPRTIIEAMMMQKPVVATNIRGSREEVESNKTGLLVPIRDSKKLADAIYKIYSNPKWAAQLGFAGRKKALRYYDESKVISLQIKKISELFIEKL